MAIRHVRLGKPAEGIKRERKPYEIIEEQRAAARLHDVIVNRVGLINELHGCRYGWCHGNPCTIRHTPMYGYSCHYFGMDLTTWRFSDYSSVERAFDVVDSLCDALWLVKRAGKLKPLR